MNVDMSKRQDLFETMPIMKAIMIMSLPMVLSSLVTILYNLSDTFFVATLNDSLQTAAVTLSAPILLSFNICLLYTSPSPRDYAASRMPSSA